VSSELYISSLVPTAAVESTQKGFVSGRPKTRIGVTLSVSFFGSSFFTGIEELRRGLF